MEITNKAGLPKPIYKAICAYSSKYDSGKCDITVTGLMTPPRIRMLFKKHYKKIDEEASDVFYRFMGQITHYILQETSENEKSVISERRFFTEINNWIVSGQVDHIELKAGNINILSDFKLTSAWTMMYGLKSDWIHQLNSYAYLATKEGIKISKIQIIALFRDFNKYEALRNKGYPELPSIVVPVPMWNRNKQRKYLRDRVLLHQEAEENPNDLPLCDESERWCDAPKFAVIKDGNQKATRLLDSKAKAQSYMKEKELSKRIYRIERRVKDVKCENYCDVAPFCDYGKQYCK